MNSDKESSKISRKLFLQMGATGAALFTIAPRKLMSQDSSEITHGPVLGQISSHSVSVWVRTSKPAKFNVTCTAKKSREEISVIGKTDINHDSTGWVSIKGLNPGTKYQYAVSVKGKIRNSGTVRGTFKTLPIADQVYDSNLNPRGLFNFSFGVGACNSHSPDSPMRTYRTMNEQIQDKIDFQLFLGDFIYEYDAGRDTTVSEWQSNQGIAGSDIPKAVDVMSGLVGVWENYKLYYDWSPNLQEWHRNVPSFFMFDDHEILNDINGAGTPGIRNKPALFRDIGIRAWNDYLGWANPVESDYHDDIHYSKADLNGSNATLLDSNANFKQLEESKITNLHIHWNEDHPSAGVYRIEKILDQHRLKLEPEPSKSGNNLSYSIGTNQFFSYKIGNAEFFVLDTRSMRDKHDKNNPDRPDVSMLGEIQKKWLIENMKKSEADFLFVASSVSFVIPHVADDLPDKDESWTVYLNEREELIKFWDQLKQPVLLLTGDLHNAMSAKIEDNVYEFLSGVHSSGNHYLNEEGNRPPSGAFTYNGRTVDIQWSTFWNTDVPPNKKNKDIFTVVKLNNVFNNPSEIKDPRWAAYPVPQVVVQFYDGATGDLLYAESVTANK